MIQTTAYIWPWYSKVECSAEQCRCRTEGNGSSLQFQYKHRRYLKNEMLCASQALCVFSKLYVCFSLSLFVSIYLILR